MSRVKGTVRRAQESQYGYFIQLEGDDKYYNTRFEPKCSVGDVVGIEYKPKGDNRGQVTNVKILEKGTGGYSSSGSSSGGGDNRQDSIIWQHSQEMAIGLVGLLVANEAFALKGKSDAKRIQIEELFDELTTRLFNDASNPRESVAFKGATEIEEDAAEAASDPDADPDDWDDEENDWDY